jgi:hypothetical protein
MAMRIQLCLFVLLAACASAPSAATPLAPPAPIDVDQAVRSRVEQYRQGYEVRSIDALAPLYAQNDELSLTHQGRTHKGWKAVETFVLTFFGSAQTFRLRVSELAIVTVGETGALATMAVHRTYGDGVQTVDEKGTLSLAFRRVKDDWLIVAEHYSYASAGPPP